ncbi:putative dienelactone hydrolase [Rhodopirellula rubra]|uniref:Putative dienelactone hydrolase n=1 Tax=Aporhodopirellula rubra TaxID=980271 RepID=A0A7W5E4G3_9BACT|nr:dienelactone hydrolase [Aporhodopirellula rubra]MBB3209614.1 putative dienelactone hydrolase [Aporhodopirellula rubra]
MFDRLFFLITFALVNGTGVPNPVVATQYDPMVLPKGFTAQTMKLEVTDRKRDREIPIKVYLPESESPSTVVMFSHGLGGDREGSAYLGEHWAARGYVAVFLQHAGSDSGVWKDKPIGDRMKGMQEAATGRNLINRVGDVPAVLNQLEEWNRETSHPLHGRIDTERVGMSGHSFGALTTQSVSGQSAGRFRSRGTDTRIKAAVMMSPSEPRMGNAKQAFANVEIPWMLMTGTKDTAIIGGQTVQSRRAVFPALPEGDKYELVLHDAEHSAFSDRSLPGDQGARNPNHHVAILALSTAFWDAYLRDDAAAKAWLQSESVRTVLEPKDVWQTK